ncbi:MULTISPECIES: hypothetical protein [unclassified Nocardioides]|uniref:hypothetical protein n=1 Tax=unclassified Nocardioides TaxID=2615069 RepID=UPI001054284F|nr:MULTISPECIES: hypothetical protein [unclassified Nocardioides]
MSRARTFLHRSGVSAAALLVTGVLLAGCSSDSGGEPDADASSPMVGTTGATGASPYLPVPDGVALTEPGSQLAVGDHAVVAYQPRQDLVGAFDIQVTALEKTTIKAEFSAWQLSDDQKKSNPFFVRATVENVGDTDLGGRPVPLYIVNDENVLVEATPFASSFDACPSTPLPEKFAPGAKTDVCLVYLAPDHGDLVAVSFRPEETFNPITWTGDVVKYEPPKPDKDKGKKDKGKGAKKNG